MTEVTTGLTFRQSVDHMVDRALLLMELDPGIANAIKCCTSVLQVSFPVEIRYRPILDEEQKDRDRIEAVMDALQELFNLSPENTLVFFANDNGGAYINESNNWPLRGTKGSCFEGGNRVPFTVQWPAVLPKGKLYAHPVHA